MKQTKKVKITLLLLVVLVMATMWALTGCGKDEITEIYITNNDLPRISYVEGQELDLSDGRLTAIVNGEEESTVPLTSADVSISGYDKNVVGQQTVTVSYNGLSTTFTVNVVARAVAESFETKYFVGDVFNKTMGKIKITDDDVKTITVNMNDEKISLVSFDSSKAGPATVTVRYNDGQNSYDCQFNVTVYEESDIKFTAPSKSRYSSSDEEIDISGGHLKVTSSDGKLTKHVPLTVEMITGFDLSKATMEHREEPLEQTVTVEYLGRQFTFNIYITYSGLSVINHHVQNALAGINWKNAYENGLTEEQSAAAIDAITEFYNLTDAQKERLSEEALSVVIRAGALAAGSAFYKELEVYSGTFMMDASANLFFMKSSYEQAVADLEKIKNPEEPLNVYADLLRLIEADFGAADLVEEVKIAEYIIVYTAEMQQSMINALNHLVETYALVADIPANWTAESLKEYGDDLLVAVMKIYNAGYYKNGNTAFYTNILSPWRENDDVFDILYTYFMYDYENGQEFVNNYMFGYMPLPGRLENWYRCLNEAVNWANFFANNSTSEAYLRDISGFMYQYYQALEIANEIKKSENQLWIDVYNMANGDYMNYRYMNTYTAGYLYHVRAMIDSPAFHELWANYYEVLKVYFSEEEELSAEKHKELITAMFDSFEKLTPNELMGFLSSLNLLYSSSKGEVPTLGYANNTAYNAFSVVLGNQYRTYFTEAAQPLFADLLLAMENYVLINYKENALTIFNDTMKKLIADYNALSDADKANFDEYAGVSFAKYRDIYDLSVGNKTVQLTNEEKAMFEQFKTALVKYLAMHKYMLEQAENWEEVPAGLYAVLHSQYAKILQIYNNIMETASEDAIMTLYAQSADLIDGKYTLAQAFYEIDYVSSAMLLSQSATINMTDGAVTHVTGWDLFIGYDMPGVLADLSELLYEANFGEGITLEKKEILALITRVRELSGLQASILTFMGADVAYYDALDAYFAKVLSKTAVDAKVVEILFNAEKAYIAYARDEENAELRDNFLSLMEQVKAVYGTLSAEDKTYLDETYNYYLGLYEEVKNAAEAA